MPVEQSNGCTVITGETISVYRLITLKHALSLEVKGMHRHGRSVYSLVKEEFGLKGNKQSVLDQFTAIVERRKQVGTGMV